MPLDDMTDFEISRTTTRDLKQLQERKNEELTRIEKEIADREAEQKLDDVWECDDYGSPKKYAARLDTTHKTQHFVWLIDRTGAEKRHLTMEEYYKLARTPLEALQQDDQREVRLDRNSRIEARQRANRRQARRDQRIREEAAKVRDAAAAAE